MMRSNKYPVDIYNEETETNLSRRELIVEDKFAMKIFHASAVASVP